MRRDSKKEAVHQQVRGWVEMREKRLGEQIKAENEMGYEYRSLVLQRQKQKRHEKQYVKGH